MSYLEIVKNECIQNVTPASGRFAPLIGRLRQATKMNCSSETWADRIRDAEVQHSNLMGKLEMLQQRMQKVDNALSYLNNFNLQETAATGTEGVEEQLSHLKDVANFALGESN
ncbi:hypothetical protein [Bacillus cereus]|nr:hypothetical protein [Bacillus cereus]HDR8321311.1 hypothetical protein [Bacillus cereus]HDR8330241.1 hypothetical protein [Bacillus cereus]HDR8334292.1 hypothetical protein [Bacillus cereus]